MYQNEEGKWVTDLAYYSSFQKEVDGNAPENAGQFETEEFVPASMYPPLLTTGHQSTSPPHVSI